MSTERTDAGAAVQGESTVTLPKRSDDPVTVGYRTVFRLAGDDAVAVAERNVRAWLTQKLGAAGALDDWNGLSSRTFNSQLSIVVVDLGQPGRTHRRLYRLIDQNPGGRFEISLFVAASAGAGHIVIEGARDGATTESAIDGVATPNIVRQILGDVTVLDGATEITGTPRVIRPGDESEVIDAIVDGKRTMSVIVASSLTADVDARWLEIIDQLTRYSVGVATVFVVFADAVEEVNRVLPLSLRVPGGQVRTFAPGVRLEDLDDGIAHRFLGPATLGRSIRNGRVRGALPAVHARGPRSRLLERGVPADARRTIDLLMRAELAELRAIEVRRRVAERSELPVAPAVDVAPDIARDDLGPSIDGEVAPALPPTAAPHAPRPDDSVFAGATGAGIQAFVASIRRLIQKWVKRSEVSRASLDELDAFVEGQVAEVAVATEQIDEVVGENESLRREVEELRAAIDNDDLESAIIADEIRRLDHENQRLKRQLRDAQIFYVADDTSVDWTPPTDVEELVTRLTAGEGQHPAFDRVRFTGKLDVVIEVSRRDPYGKYARDFWDYVRVLFEYAQLRAAGGFAGNVHMYLSDDTTGGHKCNPQRHAGRESDSVLGNPQWRAERVHPVPAEVEPTGLVLMDAHFKPTHRDMFAPRMHYFDDTNNTGKIYIGYIGKHLTTTLTS
ncbi:hypothetical protein Q9R08_20245 [Microbacterium sp. QXD-8]|uniref:Uncharacterized protein n=1 Tax=Microbacterium psychrotolerans TaxID=3068321 RepID=A0ABU0Z6V5_9MICO|nr:hypothetical protein [Microbacterium sp. QXD-8]MDQ7880330.1 hypothetical protein [Microbacterium sp. QXD-8]